MARSGIRRSTGRSPATGHLYGVRDKFVNSAVASEGRLG
jgi:hypothetical protein